MHWTHLRLYRFVWGVLGGLKSRKTLQNPFSFSLQDAHLKDSMVLVHEVLVEKTVNASGDAAGGQISPDQTRDSWNKL